MSGGSWHLGDTGLCPGPETSHLMKATQPVCSAHKGAQDLSAGGRPGP